MFSGCKGILLFIGLLSGMMTILVLLPVPAAAKIYYYVDEKGVMHFSNIPTSSKYQLYPGFESSAPTFPSFYPDRYDRIISIASKKYRVSVALIKAVILIESSFNPRAVSRSGARGLMQIMPMNFDMLDISNPNDPWQNIMGGTRYLRYLLNRFKGNVTLALAGYNAGPNAVDNYRGIPPYQETQKYVKKVIRHYRHLKKEN